MTGELSPGDVNFHGRNASDDVAIIGPPGTGKTTQIMARIGTLISKHDYGLSEICVATYRRDLANEILRRLAEWDYVEDHELDKPSEGRTRWIGTTHAIANRTLGDSVPTQTTHPRDMAKFLYSEYSAPYNGDRPGQKCRGQLMFRVYNWLRQNRNDLSKPHDCPLYDNLTSKWSNHPDFEEFHDKWTQFKSENKLIDFIDMLEFSLDSETTPPCEVVIADEYHDFYPLMDSVVQQWFDSAEIRVAAADPAQTINIHDGADPKFFRELPFPRIELNTSYRLPQKHWAVARKVLSNEHTPPSIEVQDKPGKFSVVDGPKLTQNRNTNEWSTPDRFTEKSPAWFVERYDGERMFLARTRPQITGIGRALQNEGILYKSQAGAGGWNNSPKRTPLYNFFQTLHGVRATPKGAGYTVEWKEWAVESNTVDTERTPENIHIDPDWVATASSFVPVDAELPDRGYGEADDNPMMAFVRRARSESVEPTLVKFSEYVGENISEWKADTVTELKQTKDREKKILRDALLNNQETINSPQNIPVSVSTIHASKGKQAAVTIVYDGVTRRIRQGMRRNPHKRANEARVWYVGLSRASHRTVVVQNAFEFTTDYLPAHLGGLAQEAVTANEVEA